MVLPSPLIGGNVVVGNCLLTLLIVAYLFYIHKMWWNPVFRRAGFARLIRKVCHGCVNGLEGSGEPATVWVAVGNTSSRFGIFLAFLGVPLSWSDHAACSRMGRRGERRARWP